MYIYNCTASTTTAARSIYPLYKTEPYQAVVGQPYPPPPLPPENLYSLYTLKRYYFVLVVAISNLKVKKGHFNRKT